MAYVGTQPVRGQYRKLTDISSSFNGVTTTFTTSVPPGTSDYYVTAGSASQLLVSLGGVIQQPDVDYTVSTNSITFTTAPAAGLSFFGVLMGDTLNSVTPSDGSITTAKLAGNLSVGLTGGSAAAPSLFFTGDSNNGIYSPGADTLAISTNGAQRVTVNSSGNIGIAVTPSTWSQGRAIELQDLGYGLWNGTASIYSIANAYFNSGFKYANTGQEASYYYQYQGTHVWSNAASGTAGNAITFSERMRIDASGRLLVGTSTSLNADSLIQAYKASGTTGAWMQSDSLSNGQACVITFNGASRYAEIGVYKHSGITNASPYMGLQQENAASNAFYWTDNSGNFRVSGSPGNIGTTGGTVVGTQTSDERIKNILGPVEYGLDTIKKIEPVRFSLKSEPETEKLGFIAQQVQPLVPQSVFDTNEHIEGEPEDAPTKLGMEYVSLIPVLVNAIKELSAKNDVLEAKVAALEAT